MVKPQKNNRQALAETRMEAVKRVLAGEAPSKVMYDLKCNRSSIYKWIKRFEEEGETGLKAKTSPGRTPKLTDPECHKLFTSIAGHSPEDMALAGKTWSSQNFQALVERKHKTSLSRTALHTILSKAGISSQRLQPFLSQADTIISEKWLKQDYPQLVDKTQRQGRTLCFCAVDNTPQRLGIAYVKMPGGAVHFKLFKEAVSTTSFIEFLSDVLHDTGKNITLFVVEGFMANAILNSQKAQRFLKNSGKKFDLVRVPRSNKIKTEPAQPNLNLTTDGIRLSSAPPLDNLVNWLAILQNSLLDSQYPLSSFLDVLNVGLDGTCTINTNILYPSTPIRSRSTTKAGLDSLISLNKMVLELWDKSPYSLAGFGIPRPGDFHVMNDLVSPDEWKKTEYGRILLHGKGIINSAVFYFSGPEKVICALSINKRPGEREFSESDKIFLRKLQPHLETAMQLAIRNWRNTLTIQALGEATDHLGIASFILDGGGNLIKSNPAADAIVKAKQQITVLNNKLKLLRKENNEKFQQALQAAIAWRRVPTGDKPIGVMRFTYPDADSIGVLVQPITPPTMEVPHSAYVIPHATVYISDPNKQRPTLQHQLIVRLFNLSMREAYLTTLLTQGNTLNEAAEMMNITQTSARTYLQHIYEKVGVKRQQDLVQRVMKSVALLA